MKIYAGTKISLSKLIASLQTVLETRVENTKQSRISRGISPKIRGGTPMERPLIARKLGKDVTHVSDVFHLNHFARGFISILYPIRSM